MYRILVLSLALGACSAVVDTDDLAEVDDYPSWDGFEVRGEVGGHDDTIRAIYVNEVARSWSGAGEYPIGTVIVKEVYERAGDERADLSYIAIMRKLDEAPGGGELQAGWLFTILYDGIDGPEENNLRCYDKCHIAAPYDASFHEIGY